MFQTAQHKNLFANLQVLQVLRGPRLFKVRHPGYGVCVLERFVGPNAREAAVAKRALLARVHATEGRPGFRRPIAVSANTDGWYLASTFIEGVSLNCADRERFRADPRAIADLGIELLDRLAHLHSRGMAHGRLEEEHIIVGPTVGLVGFGGAPLGSPRDDLQAVAGILYQLATQRPWSPSAPAVASDRPELGTALDDWLAAARDGDEAFDRARDARSWLRAVAATLPGEPPLERRVRAVAPVARSSARGNITWESARHPRPSSMRAPAQGGSESLSPPSSEMLARLH